MLLYPLTGLTRWSPSASVDIGQGARRRFAVIRSGVLFKGLVRFSLPGSDSLQPKYALIDLRRQVARVHDDYARLAVATAFRAFVAWPPQRAEADSALRLELGRLAFLLGELFAVMVVLGHPQQAAPDLPSGR